jgi:hypothetical protein
MKEYIGVKLIKAEPMKKRINVEKSNNDAPEKWEEVDGYRVIYKDGYESWSPKDVFEEAYKPLDEMR